MAHLIEPIRNESIDKALTLLREAHDFLVAQAKLSVLSAASDDSIWGIKAKRAVVNLRSANFPLIIQKKEEKFVEIINIVATVERLIATLDWFKIQFPLSSILKCHPSTVMMKMQMTSS